MSKKRYKNVEEYEEDAQILEMFPDDKALLKAIQKRVRNSDMDVVEDIKDSLEDKFFQKDDIDGLFMLITLRYEEHIPVVKSDENPWFNC